jgi:probable HAF family extracellular repeat protein
MRVRHGGGRLARLAAVGAVTAAALLGAAPAVAAPGGPVTGYRVVDLGTLPGGTFSAAEAVNGRGEVVGQSDGRAVLWRSGQVVDLGTPAGSASFALDVSEFGEVVGFSQAGDVLRAFRWQGGGELVDLPPLPGDTSSIAFGVNDRGVVVGVSLDAGSRPVLWRPDGTVVDLSATKLYRPEDADNAGRLVGEISVGGSTSPALVSAGTTKALTDRLGAASAINEVGEVTGYFFDGNHGSFTWAGGRLTEIPMLPGAIVMQAQAVNNHGVVVGFSQAEGFRWDGVALAVLPGLAGPLAAQDINDRGWIAGTSTAANGNSHAVVLLPQ